MVQQYFKTLSRIWGEPTDPKIRTVGWSTGNLEATKLVSVEGKPSHTYGNVKYKDGRDKLYK